MTTSLKLLMASSRDPENVVMARMVLVLVVGVVKTDWAGPSHTPAGGGATEWVAGRGNHVITCQQWWCKLGPLQPSFSVLCSSDTRIVHMWALQGNVNVRQHKMKRGIIVWKC